MTTPRELALLALDVLHDGQTERLDQIVTEDFVDHGTPPGMPAGRAGYAAILTFLREVLQVRYETHAIVAEGDYVAIHATAHGVDNSSNLGFAPTGKPFAMPTMHFYRVRDALLAEHWGVRDELSVLRQVGTLPYAPAPAAMALPGAPATS